MKEARSLRVAGCLSAIAVVMLASSCSERMGSRVARIAGPAPTSQVVAFSSPAFLDGRECYVYLPKGYGGRLRYPVLYVHDGQAVFQRLPGYPGTWGLDSICDVLIDAGELAPLIVVAIRSSSRRAHEYIPLVSGGDEYLRALRDVLKPAIDRRFRTLPNPSHTALMGASLGGLISVYGGYAYGETFARVASISGTFGLGVFYDFVSERGRGTLERMYLDTGAIDDNEIETMRSIALTQGFIEGRDLQCLVAQGQTHEWSHFATRLPGLLRFLIGPASTP